MGIQNLHQVKSELKGQIVSKFDLGLFNAYKPMYFDRNISEKGIYLSCVTNGEFHFRITAKSLFHTSFTFQITRYKKNLHSAVVPST